MRSAWPLLPQRVALVAQPLAREEPLVVVRQVVQQAALQVVLAVLRVVLQVVRLAQAVRRLVEPRPVELPPRVVPLPLPQVALQA